MAVRTQHMLHMGKISKEVLAGSFQKDKKSDPFFAWAGFFS